MHVYMDTLWCVSNCSHASIYTSNLLVMRSVISLELREGRTVWKGKKRGKGTPMSCFPTGGQGAILLIDCYLKREVCVCALTDRIQNRCDQQVFPPQELAVSTPGVDVRVEPGGTETRVREHSSSCYIIKRLEAGHSSNPKTSVCVLLCLCECVC